MKIRNQTDPATDHSSVAFRFVVKKNPEQCELGWNHDLEDKQLDIARIKASFFHLARRPDNSLSSLTVLARQGPNFQIALPDSQASSAHTCAEIGGDLL